MARSGPCGQESSSAAGWRRAAHTEDDKEVPRLSKRATMSDDEAERPEALGSNPNSATSWSGSLDLDSSPVTTEALPAT